MEQQLRVRMDLQAMEMKGYTTFPKAPRQRFHDSVSLSLRLLGYEEENVLVNWKQGTNQRYKKYPVPWRTERPARMWWSWRCPWCNGYRRRKWTRRHEFKSWTRQIAFHIALIPLGKVWIHLMIYYHIQDIRWGGILPTEM